MTNYSTQGIDCPVPTFHIPLIRPYLPPGTKERVNAVLESGFLTEGAVTRQFEAAVSEYVQAPHAIAVTSCTTGLEMALRALGIGPGAEVIVPDYTHPATAAVVNIVGATLILVDVDPHTMLIDYDAAESAITTKTKAILPVSQFGNPLDYDRLEDIRSKYGVFIIEDAACSLGASYRGEPVGSQADIAVFSMHPRKFITTGEGGVVVTSKEQWADWMRSYKNFGIGKSGDERSIAEFLRIGTNYKMSDILTAVGLAQMEQIDEMVQQRRHLAAAYRTRLDQCPDLELPAITDGGEHSWQTFCALVQDRDRIRQAMRDNGIEAQIGTYALHRHQAFAQSPLCRWHGNLAGSDKADAHCLALPLYHEMMEQDIDTVTAALMNLVQPKHRNSLLEAQ